MCEQLDALHARKRASIELSEACLQRIGTPGPLGPLVKLYDQTVLKQDLSVDMAVLLGRIK